MVGFTWATGASVNFMPLGIALSTEAPPRTGAHAVFHLALWRQWYPGGGRLWCSPDSDHLGGCSLYSRLQGVTSNAGTGKGFHGTLRLPKAA